MGRPELDIDLFKKLIGESARKMSALFENDISDNQIDPIERSSNDYEIENAGIENLIEKSKLGNIYYLEGDWLKINLTPEYKKLVYATLQYARPEIIFTQIFHLIVKKNFNALNKSIPSRKTVLDLYYGFSEHILHRFCKVAHQHMKHPVDIEEWNKLNIDFDDHIDGMQKSILDYVMYQKDLMKNLEVLPENISQIRDLGNDIFQTVMLAGYGMATKRLNDELNNDKYISAEIVDYNDSKEFLIYLTPWGMINHKKIIGPKNNGGIEYYHEFLNENQISLIKSNYLRIHLNSRQIIEFERKTYAHQRKVFDYSNDFMVNRLNKLYDEALLGETQVNFRLMEN